MTQALLPPAGILTLLRDNQDRIASLTMDLTPVQLRTAPEPGAWSLTEILAHLRSCGDVWGNCIATMLAEDHPTIRAINPRTWMEHTDYPELEFAPSFAAFSEQRNALLTTLDALSPGQWERGATVIGAGKPLTRTVHFYARWLGTHERSHLREIGRVATAVRQ